MAVMRVGYGYHRSERAFAGLDVDRVFIDTKSTDRQERADMVQHLLRRGDTVVLLYRGDLARGVGSKAVWENLERMGVNVEVASPEEEKETRPRGRPQKFDPDPDQDEKIETLWRQDGVYLGAYVVRRATEIMGHPVTENHLQYRYGPRSSTERPKRR